MFERPDLTDAYTTCLAEIDDLARYCFQANNVGIRLAIFNSGAGGTYDYLFGVCKAIAKYTYVKGMRDEAVAFRDQVQLAAIACRSLVCLVVTAQEFIDSVIAEPAPKYPGETKVLLAELTAALALIRMKCDEILPLAELWLKESP